MNVSLSRIIDGFGDLLLDHLQSNLPDAVPAYKQAIAQVAVKIHSLFIGQFTESDLRGVTENFAAYQTVRKVEYRFCDAASSAFTGGLRKDLPEVALPSTDDGASHLAHDFLTALLEEKLTLLTLYKLKVIPSQVMKAYHNSLATHIGPLAQELRKVVQLNEVVEFIATAPGIKLSRLEKEWHNFVKQTVVRGY